MSINIRNFNIDDKDFFIQSAKDFYNLPAVAHAIPESTFHNTFNECLRSKEHIHGYILEYAGQAAGYALVSMFFSAEVGGMCVMLEEAYILPNFQNHGIASNFFDFVEKKYIGELSFKRLRLEVTKENQNAIKLYERRGFDFLPYLQMIRDF